MASLGRHSSAQTPEVPPSNGLTPSDQLLALLAVNVILACWVGFSFWQYYDPVPPHLPTWLYLVEAAILGSSFFLSLWPQLKAIAKGDPSSVQHTNIPIVVLKSAVFVLTFVSIVVIWQLAEETGGVMSPYAPFLPAPAVFGVFVTKKPETIIGLSLVVTVFIAFSTLHVPEVLPDIKAYQGSAAVMVLLAGVLSWLRARGANVSERLSTQESADSRGPKPSPDEPKEGQDWPDLDDDDLAPGMES